MMRMRMLRGALLVGLIVFATGSVIAVRRAEKAHYATYGHFISYGWHVDVGTVDVDPLSAVPHPDPNGGIVVPAEGQWTRAVNFTLLPGVVEACMSGNIPVYPLRIEKLDRGTGKWTVWPPCEKRICTFPIRSRVMWPLQSFDTYPHSRDQNPLVPKGRLGKDCWPVKVVACRGRQGVCIATVSDRRHQMTWARHLWVHSSSAALDRLKAKEVEDDFRRVRNRWGSDLNRSPKIL
jgi:hypothetical protein